MFKLRAFPGWFLGVLGFCWEFLGIWARIDFLLRKVFSESIILSLSTFLSSLWFSRLLMAVGLIWIYLVFAQENGYWPFKWQMIPLKKATQKLYAECEGTGAIKFITNHIENHFSPDEVLNVLAGHIAQTNISIFGKHAPSTSLREIDKTKLTQMQFGDEASSLYLYGNSTPEFTDLAVKKSELRKAIREIIKYMEDYVN